MQAYRSGRTAKIQFAVDNGRKQHYNKRESFEKLPGGSFLKGLQLDITNNI